MISALLKLFLLFRQYFFGGALPLEKGKDQPGTRVISSGKVWTDIVVGAVLELMDTDIRVSRFLEGIMHCVVLCPPVIGIMFCVE